MRRAPSWRSWLEVMRRMVSRSSTTRKVAPKFMSGSCQAFDLGTLFRHVVVGVMETCSDGAELVLQFDEGVEHVRVKMLAFAFDEYLHRSLVGHALLVD